MRRATLRRHGRGRGLRAPGAAPSCFLLAVCLALASAVPGTGRAQVRLPGGPPERIGSIPLVLGEHGDPALAVPFGVTVAASAIYDIATAPASARRTNERRRADLRSPSTALRLSLGSTVVPVAAGVAVGNAGSAETGALLAFVGVVAGPSVGHVYAGRPGRGLATAALRLGLAALTGLALIAAS